MIRGEELTFEITCAICDRCGEFMSVPGIIDLNVREVDEQYRKLKDLVTIEDIYTLMKQTSERERGKIRQRSCFLFLLNKC